MECKFYKVCPNGGIFTRCKTSGYAAECVPHIFDALEDEKKDNEPKTPNAARVSVGLSPIASLKNNPATEALAELAHTFEAQASATHEPKEVIFPVPNDIKFYNDRIAFIKDGKEVAYWDGKGIKPTTQTDEPKRVKVRKHKRKEEKTIDRVVIGKDKLSFICNGKEIVIIDEEHPFGAYTEDFTQMFKNCKTLKPLPPYIPTNPVPTMERPK